jgi:TPR repeat protein
MLSPMSPDQGVPKDAQKAMQLYLRSAAHGDVLSQVILATAYRRGQGVEVDMIAALMWREVAAVAAEEQPGEFQLRNLRKSYEEFAAKQSSEQVAEAHQRALAYLQTRKW